MGYIDGISIFIYVLFLVYLIFKSKKNELYQLLLSFGIAFVWVSIARNYYHYNHHMLEIFGITLFPLFAWALGLFIVYLIYSYFKKKSFILFVGIYWSLLIFVETFAYHVLNIHDLATAGYKGLPLCNCIHAPVWMQISYFLLGLIYFGLCKWIGLEKLNA